MFAWNESKTAKETKDYHDGPSLITSAVFLRVLRPVTDPARREERMVDEGALRAVSSLILEKMCALTFGGWEELSSDRGRVGEEE